MQADHSIRLWRRILTPHFTLGRISCMVLYVMISTFGHAQIKEFYFHTERFSMDEGLYHGVISDFKPDRNGFIWIHTVGGLQLFDGMNFIDMSHLLGGSLSGNFNPGDFGDLFFLTDTRLIKINIDDYTDTSYIFIPVILNITPGTPRFLYENEENLFFLHEDEKVYQVDKKTMRIVADFPIPIVPRWLKTYSYTTKSIQPGQMEYLGHDFKLYTIDLNTHNATGRQLAPLGGIIKISPDSLITADKEFLHLHAGELTYSLKLPELINTFSSVHMIELEPGKVLLAINNNIYEFNLQSLTWTAIYQKTNGDHLVDITMRSMERDKTGNIYFSTLNEGLVKLHPRNVGFRYINAETGKKNFAKCVSVSEESNVVLMGTLEEGLLVFDTLGHLLKHFPYLPPTGASPVLGILKISDHQFVIYSTENYLLTVNGSDFTLNHLDNADTIKWSSYYTQVIEDPDRHQYFFSSHYGLATVRNQESFSHTFTYSHPLYGAHAISAFNEGYISAFRDTLKIFDHNFDMIPGTMIIPTFGYSRCIIQYDQSSVLLGTDVGLYHINVSTGMPQLDRIYDKMVYGILAGNEEKEFWFSTDYGLYKLNGAGELTNFSKELGLQENEFNTNSSYKTPSGKLYFGGINGITSFYPSEVVESKDQLETFIASFQVNNEVLARYINHSGAAKYILSSRQNNIRIDLLARGNKSPGSYNYQYLMKGLQPNWVNLGNDPKINFHLAPGNYTFYYHIADSFDPNADHVHHIRFVIQQPLYKRWWFILAAVLMALGFVYYLYRLNKRRHDLRLVYDDQLRQKIQRDRMRISRELHDNIGAQMATIKRNINFLVSNKNALSDDQLVNKMKDMEGISSQINQELRDTIWATQQEQISVQDFITRLKNYVFQTLGPDSQMRILYVEKCDKDVILGPFLALNLHRICQETISNTVRHADATELKVCFEGHGDFFKVTLIDNGKGFSMDAPQDGYGLKNIRHRAESIGADLVYNGEKGTMVEITIHKIDKTNKSFDE